jgi:hypothetical protein
MPKKTRCSRTGFVTVYIPFLLYVGSSLTASVAFRPFTFVQSGSHPEPSRSEGLGHYLGWQSKVRKLSPKKETAFVVWYGLLKVLFYSKSVCI